MRQSEAFEQSMSGSTKESVRAIVQRQTCELASAKIETEQRSCFNELET